MFEKVVLAQVFSHLNSQNLISNFQSAYGLGHSTKTALMKVANDLLTAVDTGKISVLTPLDLSAAFDTTDHDISLHHLSFRQNTDSVYSWETILPSYHSLWHSSRLCTWANSFHLIHSTSHMCDW